MRIIFKADTADHFGDNWPLAYNFGTGDDGHDWIVSTDHLHGSEAMPYLPDPKVSAELVARLLNQHYSDPDLLTDVAQALSWYINFYNDVMATAPVYREMCGDINAVDYLHGEALHVRDRVRDVIASTDEL